MKGQQRILELHSLLSKLIDSLCFQMTVNKNDDNCMSLLQILLWKRQGNIDSEEFFELYKSWLQSKSIFDLFTSKQIQCYPKQELIGNEMFQSNFMNIGQITKALQAINQAYNRFYIEKKPKNQHLIEKVQRIFSYLDTQGYIHIRTSSLFFLAGALSIAQNYSIPINFQAFKIYLNDVKHDFCEVRGIVSLRSFKNYFIGANSIKRIDLMDKIMQILFQIEKKIGGNSGLPNIMQQAFNKWRFFPRFNSHDGKKTIEIYKRVFQQNQQIFFQQGGSVQHFQQKYGDQFLKCFHIDSGILREFNTIIREILNKYVDMFSKINMKETSAVTHRKKQKSEISQTKLTPKASGKQKTPTKGFRKNELSRGHRTPNKTQHDQFIRRQFGSAEKSKSKTYNARNTTPTKSYRPTTSNLYQSQANTNQKIAIKNGIEKDSFYNKMMFFKNKRVQSYEIVIKRLKGK